MNRVGKGNRRELEARKMLSADGYLVEKKNTSRWESNDFWGMFDIIAIHHETGEVRLIQVKSHTNDYYHAMKQILLWTADEKVNTDKIKIEIWVRPNREPWRKSIIRNGLWDNL
jgi:hypothetical protein